MLAVLVIYLLLAANFESVRLAFVVVSTVPAVICGVIFILLITATTLNIQSFMGAIMAIGVAVANAILLVVFPERYRREGASAKDAAIEAARTRKRPILMTATAMTFGMILMALGKERVDSFDVRGPNEGCDASQDVILVYVKALIDRLASRWR